ncbi:8147_t:CDS:2 [Funneliformis geosporum]|uniref:8147_t:CDS:1 n=1 Tax=Funneliformis geosporum TaxID=1117311 RepID=A0A9W4SHF1_9GLOM|nr:8147_t:CDS:2 [Funneliformis geosporum]
MKARGKIIPKLIILWKDLEILLRTIEMSKILYKPFLKPYKDKPTNSFKTAERETAMLEHECRWRNDRSETIWDGLALSIQ